MVYAPGGDHAAWRKAFLDHVNELFGEVPPRAELAVETLGETVCDRHVRYDLEIRVSEITTLPAHLLVPDDIAVGEKRPAICALHGHVPGGRDTVAGINVEPRQSYGLDAVRAGYVVIAPAWWGFPARDGHVERVGERRDRCNVIQMAASMYGINVLALHMQDARAAIDVLAARPEVDAQRIGCIGNSYGGRTAMWAAALDERIAATVASGSMNTFRERSLKLASCAVQCPPGLLRYGDVAEVFATIAPRALQLMNGKEDGLTNDADVAAIADTVRHAYADAGAAANLDIAEHPGGHWLVWNLAEPFLRKHLAAPA